MHTAKTYHLILLTIVLLAPRAVAQNGEGVGIVRVHDWTVQIGSARYGVSELRLPGNQESSLTTVYIGGPLFSLRVAAVWTIAVVLLPLASTGVFMLTLRDKKSGFYETPPNHALQRL